MRINYSNGMLCLTVATHEDAPQAPELCGDITPLNISITGGIEKSLAGVISRAALRVLAEMVQAGPGDEDDSDETPDEVKFPPNSFFYLDRTLKALGIEDAAAKLEFICKDRDGDALSQALDILSLIRRHVDDNIESESAGTRRDPFPHAFGTAESPFTRP